MARFESSYEQFQWNWRGLIRDTYQCSKCSHIFRHYDGDVEEYHREKYRQAGEEGEEIYPVAERTHYVNNFLSCIRPYIDNGDTVLEVGSGDGLFAVNIKRMTDNIICSEIDQKMAQKCIDLGFETINESVLDFTEDIRYDAIVAMDVLEHVLDLQGFKDKMSKIVAKYLMLQVPVDRTMVPPNPTFDGHSHYFSPNSIVKLFESDFELVKAFRGGRNTFARGPEMVCIFKKREIDNADSD